MDGKPNAEKRIKELLSNETLLKSLASSAKEGQDGDAESGDDK